VSVSGIAALALLLAMVFIDINLLVLIIVLVLYVLSPWINTVAGIAGGKYKPSAGNFLNVLAYYYLVSFYDIIVLFLFIPVVAVSMVAGPLAFLFLAVGLILLGIALLQVITASRLGLADMTEKGAVIISVISVILSGLILYLNHFRLERPIGDTLSDRVHAGMEKVLSIVKNGIEENKT
jgi:uncharacterized membrane protein YidH (DUF202 family)